MLYTNGCSLSNGRDGYSLHSPLLSRERDIASLLK